MFWGSPVMVATLPMLAEVATASRYGRGFNPMWRVARSTNGSMTRQMMSLTKKAESKPVIKMRVGSKWCGFRRVTICSVTHSLAACSVAFLCVGMQLALFSGRPYSPKPDAAHALVPAGVVLSLWIWRRFGLSYAFPAAMVFALFLSGYWTSCAPQKPLQVAICMTLGANSSLSCGWPENSVQHSCFVRS